MNDPRFGRFWREMELRNPQRHPEEWSGSRFPDFPLCAQCLLVLERHQPDGDRPENILATCNECGAWYLVDEEGREVYPLPTLDELQLQKKKANG